MLEELPLIKASRGRPLRRIERELIERMLAGKNGNSNTELSSALVEDMQDGGMGSILFLTPGKLARHFGQAVAKAEYIDEDGVPVSIVINVDQDGELYEVDFWKVDFSPLRRYPKISEIKNE
jgi:hypothetical protein